MRATSPPTVTAQVARQMEQEAPALATVAHLDVELTVLPRNVLPVAS